MLQKLQIAVLPWTTLLCRAAVILGSFSVSGYLVHLKWDLCQLSFFHPRRHHYRCRRRGDCEGIRSPSRRRMRKRKDADLCCSSPVDDAVDDDQKTKMTTKTDDVYCG